MKKYEKWQARDRERQERAVKGGVLRGSVARAERRERQRQEQLNQGSLRSLVGLYRARAAVGLDELLKRCWIRRRHGLDVLGGGRLCVHGAFRAGAADERRDVDVGAAAPSTARPRKTTTTTTSPEPRSARTRIGTREREKVRKGRAVRAREGTATRGGWTDRTATGGALARDEKTREGCARELRASSEICV